ncbi:cation-transporting ATPase [Kingella kingae]|nr:cation-transporting ATPase [Kingella kingae]
MSTALPTPLCTTRTRRSLSPCPNLNLNHYKKQPARYNHAVIPA